MHFLKAVLFINSLAMFAIFLSDSNKTPLNGIPPYRIGGIFVAKHILITFISGTIIALMSDKEPSTALWCVILYGILFQFFAGQLIHLCFGVKTMLLYKMGLSVIPDGTGRLATPVLCNH